MPTTRVITNHYRGTCTLCNQSVAAGSGEATNATGAWTVRHLSGQCPTPGVAFEAVSVAPVPAAQRPLAADGYYYHEGYVYHVAPGRQAGSASYARRLVLSSYGQRGRWVYARGMMRVLDPAHVLTVEEAARLGHVHGVCMVCGRTLTDPVSVENGIGPVCMGRLRRQAAERDSTLRPIVRQARTATLADRLERTIAARPVPSVMASAPVQGTLVLDELGQGEVR